MKRAILIIVSSLAILLGPMAVPASADLFDDIFGRPSGHGQTPRSKGGGCVIFCDGPAAPAYKAPRHKAPPCAFPFCGIEVGREAAPWDAGGGKAHDACGIGDILAGKC